MGATERTEDAEDGQEATRSNNARGKGSRGSQVRREAKEAEEARAENASEPESQGGKGEWRRATIAAARARSAQTRRACLETDKRSRVPSEARGRADVRGEAAALKAVWRELVPVLLELRGVFI